MPFLLTTATNSNRSYEGSQDTNSGPLFQLQDSSLTVRSEQSLSSFNFELFKLSERFKRADPSVLELNKIPPSIPNSESFKYHK